ncbi:MAG: 6-hydroxymethylpterin diphosphokinase MptE-like protein [Acetivibrio sp.]
MGLKMSSVYKKNMEKLKQVNPKATEIFELIEKIDKGQELLRLKGGNLYFQYENTQYRLHSCKKEEETKWIIKDLDLVSDYLIVLFGMGNIHLLNTLDKETTEATKIMVIEPNPSVYKYMMKEYNLVTMIEGGKFAFICGTEEMVDVQFSFYIEKNWNNLAQNIKVLSLGNYHVYHEFCKRCISQICARMQNGLWSLGNSLEDMLDGLENHYLNVDASIRTNGIREVRDQFSGCPAVIVASGPSLDKNIRYLKEVQDKALILSCDASMEACKKNGVKPDIIASIERYIGTYKYYYEGKQFDKDLILVAPSLMWPETYENFPGKTILLAKSADGMEKWWSDHFENEEFGAMGHSCVGAAFAFAKAAGCNPIILIGQDLAYTDEKIHSDSAHTKYEGENTIHKEDAPSSDLWTEDIYGNPIRTSYIYNLFRYFYEEQLLNKSRKVIDATEGGAKIKGTEIMTFREAIDTYCTEEIKRRPKDLLEDITVSNRQYIEKYEEIILSAKDMIKQVEEIKEMAVTHFQSLEKYIDWDNQEATEQELIDIVKAMEPGNDIVFHIAKEGSQTISFYQQILKQTIIYVKKIGNELSARGVKRNLELQLNLMNMLETASIVTIQRFEKMISFLEDKKEKREAAENGRTGIKDN